MFEKLVLSLFIWAGFVLFSQQIARAGSISGTITEQGTGTPLAGIDIDVLDGNYVSIPTPAKSDAAGNYSVTNLPAGLYLIRADPTVAQGYVDQYNGGVFLRSQASFLNVPSVGNVTVDFSLFRGAVISGRITVENTGTAAANIDLDIFTDTGEFLSSVNAKTDASGNYTIGALPPGTYFVRADPDPSTFLISRFYLNGVSRKDGTPIPVTSPAPITGINIQIPQGGLIRGVVRDAVTAAPVAGLDLDVFDAAGNFQRSGGTTSATGYYEIGPYLPGDYYVRVDPDITTGYPVVYYADQDRIDGATLVTVSLNSITSNIDMNVRRGGTISGHIQDDVTAAPLEGIDLDVFNALGRRMPVNAKTDAAGNYKIGAVPAGDYYVRADPTLAQGYAPEYYDNMILEASGQLVAVVAGADTPNINFSLSRAAVVEGILTGSDTSAPVAGIDLDLFLADGSFYSPADAISSVTGFFRLGPLPPGTWVLQADPTILQGYVDEYYGEELAFGRAARIALNPAEIRTGVNITLDPGGLITGTVRFASTGLPAQGIDLDIFTTARLRVEDNAKTDVNGNYTLGLVPAGDYYVRVDPPAASGLAEKYYDDVFDVTSASPISVSVGQTTAGIDFSLEPPPTTTATPTPSSPVPTDTPAPSDTNTPVPSSTPSFTPTTVSTVSPTPTVNPSLPTATPDGDLSNDDRVDAVDLVMLVGEWRKGNTGSGLPGDFNGNGKIDPDDLYFFAVRWKTVIVP